MRLVSFNIAGKGILSRTAQWVPENTLEAMFSKLEADIVCFQETKTQIKDLTREMAQVPGFTGIFTSVRGRPGYDGVAFYVRKSVSVLKAEEGLTGWLRPQASHEPYRLSSEAILPGMYPLHISESEGLTFDDQARALTLDLGVFVLIGLYCPADSQGNMTEYRDEFFELLNWRVTKLREAGRDVVVMGDLNVAREPRDSAPLVEDLKRQGIPVDEEEWMYGSTGRKVVNNWIQKMQFHDTGREAFPDRDKMFTCWDQSRNCRPANFGARIDYVLCSPEIKCTGADIMPDLVGSDHCPVYADLDVVTQPQKGHPLPPLAKRIADRWPQSILTMFGGGKRKASTAPLAENSSRKLKSVSSVLPSADYSKTKEIGSSDIQPQKVKGFDESIKVETNARAVAEVARPRDDMLSKPKTTRGASIPKAQSQGSVAALFGAKNSQWLQIKKRTEAPLCKHGQPCIRRQSSKPPRKGEYFWMCSRPMGGNINESGEYRCKTFIWDTERK